MANVVDDFEIVREIHSSFQSEKNFLRMLYHKHDQFLIYNDKLFKTNWYRNYFLYFVFKNDVSRRAHVNPLSWYLTASDERLCGEIDITVVFLFGS